MVHCIDIPKNFYKGTINNITKKISKVALLKDGYFHINVNAKLLYEIN